MLFHLFLLDLRLPSTYRHLHQPFRRLQPGTFSNGTIPHLLLPDRWVWTQSVLLSVALRMKVIKTRLSISSYVTSIRAANDVLLIILL
jgi:hypothetical protein